jgi:putative SOS response-associated peptidase YedK
MCGRYASSRPPEFLARLFHTVNRLPNVAPSWNIAPSQDAMVVRRHPDTGERHLDLLKWGLLPSFTKDPAHAKRPINARAETVATSGMFRSAFDRRRCLVPADAFYEWKGVEGDKQPYAIAPVDGQPMAFAGLWEGFRWPDGTVARTFTIITTDTVQPGGNGHVQRGDDLGPIDHGRIPCCLLDDRHQRKDCRAIRKPLRAG